MKLHEWIKITGIKQWQLARMLGISDQRMTRILKHGSTPYQDEMVKLFWLTGGKVRPDDFFALPPIPAELRHLLKQPLTCRRDYERINTVADKFIRKLAKIGERQRHRRKRPALDH